MEVLREWGWKKVPSGVNKSHQTRPEHTPENGVGLALG